MRTTSRVSLFFLPLLYQSYRESAKRAISAACTSRPVHVADAALACAELSAPCVRATVSCWREHVCAPRNPLCVCAPRNPLCIIQAALAVNFLGPCAAACKRSNSFLNARCTTYTTTPHLLSLKAQKCDPTCTSPAAGRSGTHSGPGNTSRQICTLRRGGRVPKAPPVRTLTGCTHRSCMRAPPAPPTRPAAPERLLPLR